MPSELPDAAEPTIGKVLLVGAGPGAADLITVRGRECLGRAEVVLYDYLANPDLLQFVPESSERICLGRHGNGRLWSQPQINETLVDRARQGRIVVRLKGGDPSIFGCAAQEVGALVQAGVPFEIVPGVTAGIAAAGSAGIPITHREFASAVAFVTGREDRDKDRSNLDYAALAGFPGTLVFYMGTTTVDEWSSGLIAAGLSRKTPVAIVRRATLDDQMERTTTLGEVSAAVRTQPPLRPPVVFICLLYTSPSPRD